MPLQDKIALVTGANSGTGYVTALELARDGATVVLLCRDAAKAETAKAEIIAETGNPRVEVIVADLAEMAQVARAAEAFDRTHARLDILVNNAGGVLMPSHLSAEGVEAMFAGNYLGHVLLTNRLLPALKAASAARIVNVSSIAHNAARIHFDALRSASGRGGYGQSKLAQILFTYALAERLRGTAVTVNAMHPGVVASGFKNGVPLGWKRSIASAIYALVGISSEKGADTILWLATSPAVAGVTGRYFIKRKAVRSKGVSYDASLRERLWGESEKLLTELRQPPRPWS